jgi:hypothetical protein
MIPQEGVKGAKPIYDILFTHLGISCKSGYVLGEVMWCLVGMHILAILFGCCVILGHFSLILVLGFCMGMKCWR